ncbi:hypothetical protein LTR36_003050 [Oleoguttula mirabilis]|uniref:Uncharacterized protein n=1 Tax=Oleoguttula mirabilis TaxID=1507867 RepID=A0AAV9JZL4_9PEZI|nr:hypothetical protein LTR36_003050 [Oleoguttula mirabilis]
MDVHTSYLALGFHDDAVQEAAWHALVHTFLLANSAPARDKSAAARKARSLPLVAAFMRAYGARLWSGKSHERRHLARPYMKSGERSFAYTFDGHLRGVPLKELKGRRRGEEPSEEASLVRSKIGLRLGDYIREIMKVGVEGEVGEGDADALVATIVGATGGVGDGDDSGVGDEVGPDEDRVGEGLGDSEREAGAVKKAAREQTIKLEEE